MGRIAENRADKERCLQKGDRVQRTSDKLLIWASVIEENTVQQALTASTMPFVTPHVALMPDAHLGMGSTVGSVIPTLGAIMPAAVGVDIGCGMGFTRTPFKRRDFTDDLPYLRELIVERVPMGIGPSGTNKEWYYGAKWRVEHLETLAKEDYERYAKDWRLQLGSLGSGNHFIEFAYDEEDTIWITLHSGSRGVGNKAAGWHIARAEQACKRWFVDLPDKDLAFFPTGTPEFDEYIRDVQWAQQYARYNRDEMMDRIVSAVAEWAGYVTLDYDVEEFDCHHNFTVMEHHMGRDLWITRKGAVRAREGDMALIPGSMGTPSYVVKGKGNKPSFDSAPHGAGRAMGRKQAFRTISMEDARTAMNGILWGDHEKLIDETPGAYKDITQVIADAADLIEVKHILRPIMNIKGY
jgi:tRNA-splicing ligase RtcB